MNLDLFVLLSCECYRVRVLEEVLEALPGRAAATKSGKCPTLCQIATAVTRPRLPTLINSQPCHCGAAPPTQTDGCCCNTCNIRAANKPSRSLKLNIARPRNPSWSPPLDPECYRCRVWPQSLLGPGTRAAALPWLLMSTVSLLQTRVRPAGELYPLTGCSVPSPALIHAVLSVCDSVKLKPMHQGFCQFNMLSNVPISSK